MASVTSLGIQLPTTLPYLIQEHLLPSEPPADAYTWQNTSSYDNGIWQNDELLITKTCVVWSRGGLVRKSFRFEVEGESVKHALLTTFSNERQKKRSTSEDYGHASESSGSVRPSENRMSTGLEELSKLRSKALVVFLETQAHIYFLSGSSHVIHLPFEVEYVSAAPEGVIIQRKLQTNKSTLASFKLPRVPPNSFISSQVKPWSAKSSQQSNFSIASLGSPKQLPFPTTALLGEAWQTPVIKDDSNWPRLFSLTDPLAEFGLLVTASKEDSHRRLSTKVSALDPAEEIIHITSAREFASINDSAQDPLILAVTLNRETSMFTVWKLTYVDQEDATHDKPLPTSGTLSRRRSSFNPTTATGATTPMNSQYNFRESIGGGGLGLMKSLRDDNLAEEKPDFATTLDPDFDATGIPRRKSRRVSSMLARADLSANHERNNFSDIAAQHTASRRGDSLGSQRPRNSLGLQNSANGHAIIPESQFGNSIGSFLEAPVDDLLEELRAGGDFEGFNSMGLDDEDFEGLKKEIILTKIETVAAEHSNVRFSSHQKPAQSRCRTFSLTAPLGAAEDAQKNQIVICILDTDEKKLLVITLNMKRHSKVDQDISRAGKRKVARLKNEIIVVTFGEVRRAKGVLDACKLTDGDVSRILILTQSVNGVGDLTLQAPWSLLMKVALPENLAVTSLRGFSHDTTHMKRREEGLGRVISQAPNALCSLRNPGPGGIVDIVDDEGRLHRLRINMEPRNPVVKEVVEICKTVLLGTRGGEDVLVGWWNVRQWLGDSNDETETEWTAIIIVLFALILGGQDKKVVATPERKRKSRTILRSSSGAQSDSGNWNSMVAQEMAFGGPQPSWMTNGGWAWVVEEDVYKVQSSGKMVGLLPQVAKDISDNESPLRHFIKLTRDFIVSSHGQAAFGRDGYMPTALNRSADSRQKALSDIVIGLHLLREDQKLDITTVDSLTTSTASLNPIVAQMCRWLGWDKWAKLYDVEDSSIVGVEFESTKLMNVFPPFDPPSIHEWIESCLIKRILQPFPSLGDIVTNRSGVHNSSQVRWSLTPRTALFMRFFDLIRPSSTPAELVEALYASGFTRQIIDTLPEAITVPIREAIATCQSLPPVFWDKELLNFVDRGDVNRFLQPGEQSRVPHVSLLAPTHETSIDTHTICAVTVEPEPIGSFDESAEMDRHSITRLVFKDDRRFNEAAKILNTSKPTIARCEAEPDWSESDLLDAQKEHVQVLAYRTLAIPTGRGLLYFSARIPLLTEKFPIGGFNLHCVMKPTNNTVGVDKMAFTEEKVCWSFFHAGVSAGLSISRAAKGIDTSWILYNKPQELSNRHAGFLLALGLNGHLKSVAKWVAFKYLTPRHTMTSIGLLLGLAASYLGTMDSLITRLLSVHVTRMLPPGAAELNLSPLTQTTGILGIGLLYCSTQHRRMSEIMLSEIEQIEAEVEDEPLRNEGYRLAAGFALGLINLGKGSDLKGLHDMHLTERLLSMSIDSKKIDLVHILDKATSAAVVAIAFIFMKSENQALARKIDVPDSIVRYDYVRPDVFLLRTMAKHLILWSKIEASENWIASNLPVFYRDRSKLVSVDLLKSEDLPFYNIMAGLCFSIALRYSGSGSHDVRDLLIHYLDQLIRICHLPATNYDQRLTRNTTRNCQDLIAISLAVVMAGTGDLAVFRRLRALHGRDDNETPYGSHLAAHVAIGALFLGGGTYTFGTSNLAIASLIIAFYPIFPTTILDNKSHLQAFRHFWVLGTEARCLVIRDIDTNRPISIPLSISCRNGKVVSGYAPCFLPDLRHVTAVSTNTREYWKVVLEFEKNPKYLEAFKANQTMFVRRRPAYDASTSIFHSTLQALDDTDDAIHHPLEWIFSLPAFKLFSTAERALVLPPDTHSSNVVYSSTEGTLMDTRLVLEKATLQSGKRDRLQGLKLLFSWAAMMQDEGREMNWIRREVLERLQANVWMMSMGKEVDE